jgi:hypothetical protein
VDTGNADPGRAVPPTPAAGSFSGGLGLTATGSRIHQRLVQVLVDTPNLPLDIFQQINVLREEHYFVPAYVFFCTGTASYTYEYSVDVKRTWTEDRAGSGNTTWQTTKTETDAQWHTTSANANVSRAVYAPMNGQFGGQISRLFNDGAIDGKLVPASQLSTPADAVYPSADLSEQQAYAKYAVSSVNELLRNQINEAVVGRRTRSLQMGGASIQKDSAVDTVLLGLYRIVLEYKGREYHVWLGGDGQSGYAENLPRDVVREKLIADKKQEQEALPKAKTGLLTLGMIVGIVIVFSGLMNGTTVLSIVGVAVAVACLVPRIMKKKEYRERYNAAQREIDALTNELGGVKDQFKASRRALRGIYNGLSGDSSAF